jgi:hypothetical protein
MDMISFDDFDIISVIFSNNILFYTKLRNENVLNKLEYL